MTAVEVLNSARTILLERGWAQGAAQEHDGRVCLTGAAQIALGLIPTGLYGGLWTSEVGREVVGFLDAAVGGCAWGWNDTHNRTFNEVVDALDDAILLAKEAEADAE